MKETKTLKITGLAKIAEDSKNCTGLHGNCHYQLFYNTRTGEAQTTEHFMVNNFKVFCAPDCIYCGWIHDPKTIGEIREKIETALELKKIQIKEQNQATLNKKTEALWDTVYDPHSKPGTRSYYGEMFTIVDDTGAETLFSYSVPVVKRLPSGELVRLWDGWTDRAGRHIKNFCGLGRTQFLKLKKEK